MLLHDPEGLTSTSGRKMHVPQRTWVRAYRIAFALLTLATIGIQLVTQYQRPGFVPANFFSFFTIQSNLLAALLFLFIGTRRSRPSSALNFLRGAAAAYLILTTSVDALLLSGYEAYLQVTVLSVNTVLHQVMPLVVVLDWFTQPPRNRLSFAWATVWTVYPLLYLGYTLVRGSRVHWYPYGFLDPRQGGGYPALFTTCGAIAVGFLGGIWLLVMIGQHPWSRSDADR